MVELVLMRQLFTPVTLSPRFQGVLTLNILVTTHWAETG